MCKSKSIIADSHRIKEIHLKAYIDEVEEEEENL